MNDTDARAIFVASGPDTALAMLERRRDTIGQQIAACDRECEHLQEQLLAEQGRRAALAITKASVTGAINVLRAEA